MVVGCIQSYLSKIDCCRGHIYVSRVTNVDTLDLLYRPFGVDLTLKFTVKIFLPYSSPSLGGPFDRCITA